MYFFVIYVTKSLNGILNELIVVDIRYLCVHGQLCWIACNNIQADNALANLFATVILRVPLLFILITYMCIATALLKIAQTLDRIKTFKTCSAQIMLVAIYYWPVLIAFTLHAKILPNVSMINVSCCCPSSSVELPHLCFTYKQSLKEIFTRIKQPQTAMKILCFIVHPLLAVCWLKQTNKLNPPP